MPDDTDFFDDDLDESQFEEDTSDNMWVACATLYRIDRLSDEEMERHFPYNDGKWSAQTKNALMLFGTSGLDMNENWALLRRDWRCPACNRSKSEIFRKSDSGILLANIHSHHDHIGEYIKTRVREICGVEWEKTASHEAMRAIASLANLSENFQRSYVCSECNTIEGAAKALLAGKITDNFSFSPLEIGAFTTRKNNKPPTINEDGLNALWLTYRDKLSKRVDFIDSTIHLINAGIIKSEISSTAPNQTVCEVGGETNLLESFFRQNKTRPDSHRVRNFRADFMARSVSLDSPRLKLERRPTARKPPHIAKHELEGYADSQSPISWANATVDWSCPTCGRRKLEVIRKSKNNKLMGGLRDLTVPVIETDQRIIAIRKEITPRLGARAIIREPKIIKICTDCQAIITKLKTTRRDIGDIHLHDHEIAKCIKNKCPHMEHEVDFEKAGSMAAANAHLSESWNNYNLFHSASLSISMMYLITKGQSGDEAALSAARTRASIDLHIFDDSKLNEILPFMISEGMRLRELYNSLRQDDSCPGFASSKL